MRRSGAVALPAETPAAPAASRQKLVTGKTTSGVPAIPPSTRRTGAAQTTKTSGAQEAPQPKPATNLLAIGAAVGGVCLLIAGVVLLSPRKGDGPGAATAETGKASAVPKETPGPARPAESGGGAADPNSGRPASKSGGEEPVAPAKPLSLAEREKLAEKEMQEFRLQRGQKLLEGHKAWFRANPTEQWEYRSRLRDLSLSYRGMPAAAEAERLIGELKKLPSIRGRFVRVENLGANRILSLAEVQVFSNGKNVAVHKKASQSSTDCGGAPERAVDGNTDGVYERGSTSHTKQEDAPWWEVDLGKEQDLEAAVIWNRTEVCQERLQNFRVSVLDKDRATVWDKTVAEIPRPKIALTLTPK